MNGSSLRDYLVFILVLRNVEQVGIEVSEMSFTMDKVFQAVFCFLLESAMQWLKHGYQDKDENYGLIGCIERY
ncbi:serine/arginine repetitive matrix protein 2-like [Gossypium australe]|uniref:Serine/arginine repetitive matrix protein 2-like n=1 Tax=Gossypium australe TaxID=47621 RepID=A0A5B6WGI1_9ROSI|nr:serine/arginine repetitive matrix protein 2-like [Gossypium australe]